RVLCRLAIERHDVVSNGLSNSIMGRVSPDGLLIHGTRLLLRLPEGQHLLAVSIGNVIGIADILNAVLATAEIDTGDPTPSVLALPVAKVKLRVDRAVIGLAANLQLLSRGPRI